MNAWLQKLRSQVVQLWQGLNPSRRIIFSVGAAAIVGILILLASYAGRPGYTPLFTQLDPSDAGEIVAKLKESGIPYQLAEGGSAILVPSDKVYETRISLASAGMPRGGIVGFELFDQSKLGTTEFDRKLNYTRALQGELTRTIREINGVEDARVHVVRPEQSLFIDEKKEPTASVLLKLRPSAHLSEEQIQGIANLIAGSVEGLDPLKVTILDSQGNVLSQVLKDNADADLATGSDKKNKLIMERLSIQRQQEQELEKSVQSMLEKVFGPGKAAARVSAEMNFDYEESSSELYQPSVGDSGIVRSEQESSESYSGQGVGQAMGVPGVTSNIPGYQAVDSGNTNSQYQKRQATRNYEVSKRQEHLVSSPGKIRRLSVAVWVDGQLGPQQIASVRSLVASAVGFNEARGDQISVESLQIVPEQQVVQEKPKPAIPVATLVLSGLLAGGVIAVVVFAVRRRRKAAEKAEEAELAELGANLDLISTETAAPAVAASEKEEEAHPEEKPLDLQLTMSQQSLEFRQLEKEIGRLAKDKPVQVAQLLKKWLSEEEN